MNNYSEIAKQDIENSNAKDTFEGTSNEERELFKRAITEALNLKIRKIEEETKDIEIPPKQTAQDKN